MNFEWCSMRLSCAPSQLMGHVAAIPVHVLWVIPECVQRVLKRAFLLKRQSILFLSRTWTNTRARSTQNAPSKGEHVWKHKRERTRQSLSRYLVGYPSFMTFSASIRPADRSCCNTCVSSHALFDYRTKEHTFWWYELPLLLKFLRTNSLHDYHKL